MCIYVCVSVCLSVLARVKRRSWAYSLTQTPFCFAFRGHGGRSIVCASRVRVRLCCVFANCMCDQPEVAKGSP